MVLLSYMRLLTICSTVFICKDEYLFQKLLPGLILVGVGCWFRGALVEGPFEEFDVLCELGVGPC